MINFDPFKRIGEEWALFGVTADGDSNAMTVSWGEAGVLWNKPIFTVFIRPTRYTYTLAEKTDIATLSFFPEDYKKTLSYFGRVSGRDENKLEKLSGNRDGQHSIRINDQYRICFKYVQDNFYDVEITDYH